MIDVPQKHRELYSTESGSVSPNPLEAGRPRPSPLASATCSGIEVEVFGDLDDIEPEWKEFERKADCTVFQTFGWLTKWQQHIGTRNGTSPAIVFGRDAGGRMLFIMQFAIEQRGPIRHLTWLGSELCDYNAPLLADDFSELLRAGALRRSVGPDHQAAAWTGAELTFRSDRPAENAGE